MADLVPALRSLPLFLLLATPAFAKTQKPAPAPAAAAEKQAEQAPAGEEPEDAKLPEGYQPGPMKGEVGNHADLQVPEGAAFATADGTIKLLEASGNLTNGRELASTLDLENGSFVIFEFDDVGFVKDDEKDSLDADAMLKSIREGQESANVELARRKMPQLEVTGWKVKPKYNEVTHNLEWAPLVRNKDNGHESVNYSVRILGRRGVMDAQLVVSPENFDTALPKFRQLLAGFAYKSSEGYASFVSGDKVAQYGLTALVTGGAIAVAAKSGLLGKFAKFIVLIVAGAAAWLKKLFTGKKDDTEPAA